MFSHGLCVLMRVFGVREKGTATLRDWVKLQNRTLTKLVCHYGLCHRWDEFRMYMADEFANGKNLMSGEYMLPTGVSHMYSYSFMYAHSYMDVNATVAGRLRVH